MTDEEYLKQGVAALETSHPRLMAELERMPEPRRSQLKALFDGPLGEQYLMAPASSKRRFHNAFPGGLLLHSLNVLDRARKLADALWPGRWPDWKVAFCALFHDFGKAGSLGQPNYIRNKERWKEERGEFYDTNHVEWLPTSERGLFALQQAGIVLDHEEYLAIRLNDGPGPSENKVYDFRTPDLAFLIHVADDAASRTEKAAAEE